MLAIGQAAELPALPGWTVLRAQSAQRALATLQQLPAVILLPFEDPGTETEIAALRTGRSAAGKGPIGLVKRDLEPAACGMTPADFLVPRGELVATLEDWRPIPMPDPYLRLERTFEVETIRSMVARFRDLLAAALEDLDTADGPAIAHRVAGVAGTLGFAELGRDWLQYSIDPATPAASLSRNARRTIAGISRYVAAG